MLSMAADRYLASNPLLTRIAALVVAFHVINLIPQRFDPIHLGFIVPVKIKKRLRQSLGRVTV